MTRKLVRNTCSNGFIEHLFDSLTRSLKSQEAMGISPDRSLVDQLVSLNQQLVGQCTVLEQALHNPPHGSEAHMGHCAETLLPTMLRIREAVDGLELLVDDADWPLPSYQEMLFVR